MRARYTQSLFVAKARQLVPHYCVEAMKRGIKPAVPKLRTRWRIKWRRSYGLSLKKPNRTYKVPKWLLRAAAEELLGYDPHILNWDQSPFHHNESASAAKPCLAVKGASFR